MPVSAHDVAASLRARLPGLPVKKLHKLLYYSQAHHLAGQGGPLFTETISAWDMGPVVGQLWHRERSGDESPPPSHLDEAQANTVGYVVSRYGALSGRDLEHLTHQEAPWQRADAHRRPGGSARIQLSWIAEYFADGAGAGEDDDPLDSSAVSTWLAGAPERRERPARVDDLAELRARVHHDA